MGYVMYNHMLAVSSPVPVCRNKFLVLFLGEVMARLIITVEQRDLFLR
jgi:hypothetical protein